MSSEERMMRAREVLAEQVFDAEARQAILEFRSCMVSASIAEKAMLAFSDEGSGIGVLKESLQDAHNAIEQALDDMGTDGHCVCPDAKEWLKNALAKSVAALSQSS